MLSTIKINNFNSTQLAPGFAIIMIFLIINWKLSFPVLGH